jgi:hypothetical protein
MSPGAGSSAVLSDRMLSGRAPGGALKGVCGAAKLAPEAIAATAFPHRQANLAHPTLGNFAALSGAAASRRFGASALI